MTRLRPPQPDEEGLLARWRTELTSEFEDFSGPAPTGLLTEPHGPQPGSGLLVVADDDDRPIGDVTWRQVLYGPNPGSQAMDIGISLQPEARGRGHGSRAQRMLADFLFATFGVHRVQATTDVANLAEQRALERAGFRREGVLRGAQWRAGGYHDLVLYARLRDDA